VISHTEKTKQNKYRRTKISFKHRILMATFLKHGCQKYRQLKKTFFLLEKAKQLSGLMQFDNCS